jgi:flagellar biogenesis protein FliO
MNTFSQVEVLQPVGEKTRPLPNIAVWSRTLLHHTWSILKWIMLRAKEQQTRKNLRICETVSLGEKRFVAVVQVDDERFLIGGSSSAVSLLTRLQETKAFAAALEQSGKVS